MHVVPYWHVRIEFAATEPVRLKIADNFVSNVLSIVAKLHFADEPTAIIVSREDPAKP